MPEFTDLLECAASLRRRALGVGAPLGAFTPVQIARTTAWIATCDNAGFYWPPVHGVLTQRLDATAYVHEVERLCRYLLRPPLATGRLERKPDGTRCGVGATSSGR